jgi:dTDP-4-dehydrorhamnose 3,5-epimerase
VKVKRTNLSEIFVVELDVFPDDRGHFFERFNEVRFAEHGLPTRYVQDNHSRSRRGVLRGLHYQLHHPQGKLVSCIRGSVFDVAVDIRLGSPTFGKWVGVELSEDAPELMWIPPGYAHGYCALSGMAEVQYKVTAFYVPKDERGVIWDDGELAIDWPIEKPLLSPKDEALPALRNAELPVYQGERKAATAR